jgi:SAM-dependent methyltransferase
MKRLFPLVIFANAFLLFQVQPLIAKMIVPWFGGSAAVWTACLLFFQVLLLGGYLYAHWLVGLEPKMQGRIHATLLALSLLSLPIIPRSGWKPSGFEDPTLRILLVLAATVGLPYFLLSSTSPLVQAWYARGRPAGEPYRLYSLSNLGSMLALLSYPVMVEPLFTRRHQAIGWSVAYTGAGALCAWLALRSRDVGPPLGAAKPAVDTRPRGELVGPPLGVAKSKVKGRSRAEVAVKKKSQPPPSKPGWKTRWLWMALPACASALLLAITNHVCQNIAAIPLLWVLPLALYLLSFILCFEGHAWYRRRFFAGLLVLALGGMVYALLFPGFQNASLASMILLYLAGLFICCMVCHGELARLRPHPAHLTSFYLMVSLGGALGGVFVALLAPRLFSGLYELPLALVGCAALLLAALYRDPAGVFLKTGAKLAWSLALALVLALTIILSLSSLRVRAQSRLMVRNFYGVLRVVDAVAGRLAVVNGTTTTPLDQIVWARELYHGTIRHGFQFLAPPLRRLPTSYFSPGSGVGLALSIKGERGPMRVGVAGLGTATLAAYSRAGDRYTFYEINPRMVQLARTQFTFLSDSPAQIDVITGDARLSLERQAPQGFDVLVADAFSGDSVPVHLLTREAFALYFRHLKPDGVLAVNITNRYIDLEPVVMAEADSLSMPAIEVINSQDEQRGISAARWILVTGDTAFLDRPEIKKAGNLLPSGMDFPLWTDEYSSVFRLLR